MEPSENDEKAQPPPSATIIEYLKWLMEMLKQRHKRELSGLVSNVLRYLWEIPLTEFFIQTKLLFDDLLANHRDVFTETELHEMTFRRHEVVAELRRCGFIYME